MKKNLFDAISIKSKETKELLLTKDLPSGNYTSEHYQFIAGDFDRLIFEFEINSITVRLIAFVTFRAFHTFTFASKTDYFIKLDKNDPTYEKIKELVENNGGTINEIAGIGVAPIIFSSVKDGKAIKITTDSVKITKLSVNNTKLSEFVTKQHDRAENNQHISPIQFLVTKQSLQTEPFKESNLTPSEVEEQVSGSNDTSESIGLFSIEYGDNKLLTVFAQVSLDKETGLPIIKPLKPEEGKRIKRILEEEYGLDLNDCKNTNNPDLTKELVVDNETISSSSEIIINQI